MIMRKDGVIGWMIFNNPERHNAMSSDMWSAVADIMTAYEADPDVRVIVLAGAGDKAFVSGADISQFEKMRSTPEQIAQYDAVAERASSALSGTTKPVIAMIKGYCIGGGVGVALRCDLRIAAEGSRFGIPAAKLGLGYGYSGVKMLVDLVGPSVAKDIFFTARQYEAEEALRIGLINHVVPLAELESFTRNYAEMISRNAPLTVKTAKLAVNTAVEDESKRDLAAVQAAVDRCFASEDYKEGRKAFAEKRKPAFRGV
jgi:enoyl-CoA hydratase